MANVFNFRYILLESGVPYDWDDYGVWGDVLFDLEENKVITCKYGHGEGPSITGVSLKDAIAAGVDCGMLIDTMVAELHIGMPDIHDAAANYSMEKPLSIPVTVCGGRKFKGNGYLVYALREPVRYGLGAYHNEYNHYPVVYDPETKTFNKVNSFGYLKFSEDTVNFFKEAARKAIPNTIAEVISLAHAWAYDMSYAACDRRNYNNLIYTYSCRALKGMEVAECVKEGIELRNKRVADAREALKAERMPGILEWVKNNTDKTGDAAIKLAEHIFNKRY